jgi:hypothetical protein
LTVEELEAAVRELTGVLMVVQQHLAVETTINTGITLALVKAGLVGPTLVEIIRTVGAKQQSEIYAHHLGERLDALHKLIRDHGPKGDNPPKLDG